MRLTIKDFAKIKEADIIVDGITVIAGENNTGKSTIGKILFSLFNAISGIEDRIADQRIKEIEESSQMLLRGYVRYNNTSKSMVVSNPYLTAKRIASSISRELREKEDFTYVQIYDVIEKIVRRYFLIDETADPQEIIDEVTRIIQETMALSEETIMLEILTRYFNSIFNGQVNSLVEQETKAVLQLNIKNNNIALAFKNNECIGFNSEISILHKAIYIDNPFIVDKLYCYDELSMTDQFLKELLVNASKENIMDGIIESVLAKGKLSEIYQALYSVVDGQIVEKRQDEFYLQKEGFAQPIAFNNLSTGLKSFVIIKMLVEKGLLKEKDVLILDEPEIHLHPQWQISYAELIVLMQKYFDLSIIVTTHSPYFLDAVNLFSVKHGLSQKVNYYLSSMENNSVEMTCVTDNIDLIYKKMASPIQMLDSLRYELNNQ